MSMQEYLIIFIGCLITMLICRVVPILALKGRELPERVSHALGLIPPAAFAALVANDLLSPTMFEQGLWPGLMPLVAALCTFVVGYKTKSLVWCIVVGVGSYALMMFFL
ncbi:MAG: AzlD domain-containing protein [Coriobacteriales bacterium]|nr:AzlD domain-containing protein [Coriobacteriales bacterium]